jgi:uncharacterized iron-regulated membrane protein
MDIKSVIKSLREFRSLHRTLGIALAIFLLVTATTGLLLGWKKNIETLQPHTRQGSSTQMTQWISLVEIANKANEAIDSAGVKNNSIDRLDVQPGKGIIKVLFKEGY